MISRTWYDQPGMDMGREASYTVNRYLRFYHDGAFFFCNYIHYKVRDEIIYPFPNFNGEPVEVWEWIGNFIPHFIMNVITYSC